MKKFFEDFKAFAMRGNVIDMAVEMCIRDRGCRRGCAPRCGCRLPRA